MDEVNWHLISQFTSTQDETSTDDESDDVDDEMDEYSDEDVGGRNGQSTEYTEIKEQMYQARRDRGRLFTCGEADWSSQGLQGYSDRSCFCDRSFCQ